MCRLRKYKLNWRNKLKLAIIRSRLRKWNYIFQVLNTKRLVKVWLELKAIKASIRPVHWVPKIHQGEGSRILRSKPISKPIQILFTHLSFNSQKKKIIKAKRRLIWLCKIHITNSFWPKAYRKHNQIQWANQKIYKIY